MEEKTGTGPLSPDYSGLDPSLMDAFIPVFKRGADLVGQESEALRRLLQRAGLPTEDLRPVAATRLWTDAKLPDLRRRCEVARSANALRPWRTGLLPLDESLLPSPAESRRMGTDLAARFADLHPRHGVVGGKPDDAALAALIAELDAHRDDPDFTAAFFVRLGVDGTRTLADKLRVGMHDPDPAIDVVSRTFGAAVRGGDLVSRGYYTGSAVLTGTDVPGFAELARELLRTERPEHEQALGELLRAGDFPPAWLADVVTEHAFDPRRNVRGEALAGFLAALAGNPPAARLAISSMTRNGTPLPRLLRDLMERGKVTSTLDPHGDDAADAFGRMLAAAAGAYDEKDGAHSPEAARFAYDLMRALPELDTHIQGPTRIHLAEIAAAYATEIAEGADLGDANRTQASAYGPVKSAVAGSNPVFRLSPEDTYAFVKLFADSPAHVKPFEQAMGELAGRLMRAAAQADGGKGIDHLARTMRALGYTAGMQVAAERAVQGELDEKDKKAREDMLAKAGFFTNVAGIAAPLEGQALWIVLSTMATAGLSSLTEVGTTRLAALDDKGRKAALARGNWLAGILAAQGFKPTVPAGDSRFNTPPITDENGGLLPFEKIAKDPAALRNLNNWLIANGSGGADPTRLGEALVRLDVEFRGAKDAAEDKNLSPFR